MVIYFFRTLSFLLATFEILKLYNPTSKCSRQWKCGTNEEKTTQKNPSERIPENDWSMWEKII
jgi:hypothetical protein